MNGPGDAMSDQVAASATGASSSPDRSRLPERAPGSSPAAGDSRAERTGGAAADADGFDADFFLGMSSGDRIFVLTCVVLGGLLLLVHWARQEGAGLGPVEIERLDASAYNYRVDVNSATWVEFLLVDGIGEQLARRIVADREQHGPFESVDDLERVRGIGPKTLARIRPALECRPSVPLEVMESP